jgi:hypothetical protein
MTDESITDPVVYEEKALATLAPDDSIDLKRVNYALLRQALRDVITTGRALDAIKKTVCYNKPFPKEYKVGVAPTPAPAAVDPQILHAVLGIITEAAELADALNKAMWGGEELDLVNLLEESGDLDWYQALLDSRTGGTQVQRWTTNITKLAARYAKEGGDVGFTSEAAIERDTDTEREILEGGHGVPVVPENDQNRGSDAEDTDSEVERDDDS